MAQDFAKKRTSPRRGATRKQENAARQPFLQLPGWAWLLSGVVIGFAMAQLFDDEPPMPRVATAQAEPQAPPVEERSVPAAATAQTAPLAPAEAVAEQQTKTTEAADRESSKPRFDFYTLLPESEVLAPKVEEYRSTPKQPATADQANPESPLYMLQAGSFRSRADADRLRRRLTRMGLKTKINTVTGSSGDVWHRVQTGPFNNRRDLNHAQDLLADAQIESLLIRLKP